jgi:hypothetical protein
LIIICLTISNCVATYKDPQIKSKTFKKKISNKNSTFDKIEAKLINDGYGIKYANKKSGTISSDYKIVDDYRSSFDCGSNFGFGYSRDKRTTIKSSLGFTIQNKEVSLRSKSKGLFSSSGSYGDINSKDIKCISNGNLERDFLNEL